MDVLLRLHYKVVHLASMSIKWPMQVILSEALPLTASQNGVTTCIYVTNAKTVRGGME